jgi:hypothetical protein
LADGGGTFTGGVEGEQHLSDVMEVDCVTTERGEGRCVCVRESQAGCTRTTAARRARQDGDRSWIDSGMVGCSRRLGMVRAWAQAVMAHGQDANGHEGS